MVVTAEVPLIASATALAAVALVLLLPERIGALRVFPALVFGIAAALTPLVAFPLRDAAHASGRALWEWSAAGGPTVQASYRFDGIAALGLAAALGYVAAALVAVSRAVARHPLLPAMVLAIGLVSIALAVTDDLIAAAVVLGVLAAFTVFAELLVAPPAATARLAAFFATGIQAFVVAALLISRFGAPSFVFAAIRPETISPGVVLAATVGGALFAGLYPFVPWRYERPQVRAEEREPLRGLIAMPVGIGASLVLLRLLGATRIELSTLGLPSFPAELRAAAVFVLAGTLAALVARRRVRPGRAVAFGVALALVLVLYPFLGWSHAVLAAAILTVLYAAAVSLARAEEWEVVRFDVALAALWIGFACGTPTAIAAGLFVIVADALASLVGAPWSPPHRAYILSVAGATAFVGGLLGVAVGAAAVPDLPARVLAIVAVGALLALFLAHVGRELSAADVPNELDVTAAVAAFLGSLFVATLVAAPLVDELASLGRPFGAAPPSAAFAVPAIAVTATLLVVLARSLRPFVPELGAVNAAIRTASAFADPVPAAVAMFRALELGVTRATGVFALFERRAGVWLATMLIVALLVWAVR